MDNSTNQELNRMTVRHRLFVVVITSFLGISGTALSAQADTETENSALLEQTQSETETDSQLDVEPVMDQLTKQYLQELSKEAFKEYMLNMDQYGKNDKDTLLLEYQRRCSDDSKDSSADLCPDDIEPTFGNAERDSERVEEVPDMPQLVEESVQVRSTVRANGNAEILIGRDPRTKSNKNGSDMGKSSWQKKPKKNRYV